MNMKRAIKTTITITVKTIATIVFIIICAYLFGSIKVNAAEHTPELISGSITDMTQVTDFVVNDGSLQLYFNDGTGYYWARDINSANASISAGYMTFDNNYVDINAVTRFDITEYGLMIYFSDGSGYYWESDIDSDNWIISYGYMQCYDDNYVDIDTVIGFNVTEYGLMLHFSDENGYYLER